MSKRQLLTAFFILLLAAPLCPAQQDAGRQQSAPRAYGEEQERRPEPQKSSEALEAPTGPRGSAPSPLKLPEGEGAWAVQVVTRGGVMGVGRGDFTVSSDGAVTCAPAGVCPPSLAPEALRTLAEAVAAAASKPQRWQLYSADACRDCYVTTMLVQRRESDRVERTYLFSWDDLSTGKMPGDARRLYETTLALASVKQ